MDAPVYPCDRCPFRGDSPGSLVIHLGVSHGPEFLAQNLDCPCGRRPVPDALSLREHLWCMHHIGEVGSQPASEAGEGFSPSPVNGASALSTTEGDPLEAGIWPVALEPSSQMGQRTLPPTIHLPAVSCGWQNTIAVSVRDLSLPGLGKKNTEELSTPSGDHIVPMWCLCLGLPHQV